MRLLNWNIEWMNKWFTGGGTDAWRQSHDGIDDVEALAHRVADVIASLDDVDVLAVQEGPSSAGEMDLFIQSKLNPATGSTWTAFQAYDGRAQKLLLAGQGRWRFRQPDIRQR